MAIGFFECTLVRSSGTLFLKVLIMNSTPKILMYILLVPNTSIHKFHISLLFNYFIELFKL